MFCSKFRDHHLHISLSCNLSPSPSSFSLFCLLSYFFFVLVCASSFLRVESGAESAFAPLHRHLSAAFSSCALELTTVIKLILNFALRLSLLFVISLLCKNGTNLFLWLLPWWSSTPLCLRISRDLSNGKTISSAANLRRKWSRYSIMYNCTIWIHHSFQLLKK